MSEERLDIFKKCPTCGESFPVLHPDQWAYKRYKGSKGGTRIWFCSYSCMRAYEDKKGRIRGDMKNLTKEQKARAVEIAMTGESPANYLEECGVNNPHCSWWYIKKNLEKNDPEKYAALPAKFKQSARNKTVETPEGEFAAPAVVKIDGPIRIQTETPEKVEVVDQIMPKYGKCTKPIRFDGFNVTAVESDMGTFSYNKKYNLLEFRGDDGDELTFTPEVWALFRDHLDKAMKLLGVEQ